MTLPEAWRVTKTMLQLRSSTNPEIGLPQAVSALVYWGVGAVAIGVLVSLVVSTVRRRIYRLGLIFWLSLVVGTALAWSMVGPFGLGLAATVSLPALALAMHCMILQHRDTRTT